MASSAIGFFVIMEYIASAIVAIDERELHKIKTDIKFSALNNLYSNTTTETKTMLKIEYVNTVIVKIDYKSIRQTKRCLL